MKKNHSYDDIIDLPRHVSSKRVQMSRANRAAQFSPFAALTGYDGVIRETARLTEEEAELAESSMEQLNEKLLQILSRIGEKPFVTFKCFQQDLYKAGGSYVYVAGYVKHIDHCNHLILLTDGNRIPISCIYGIEL